MKFVLVNGRTPKPVSTCALCRTPLREGYVRDLVSRLSYCEHACYAADREHARTPEQRRRRAS